MKSFTFLAILLSNLVLSQNLVFTNNQRTITFKKNELININGQKYRYQKAVKNKTQIHLLKSGFFKRENITLDTNQIDTFSKYNRFNISNALKMGYFGFGSGAIYGAMYVLLDGSFQNAGSRYQSKIEKVSVGTFFSLISGLLTGILVGMPTGLVYGFFSFSEDNIHSSHGFTLKFALKNKNNPVTKI